MRSRIREDQVEGSEFLSENEFSTASGAINIKIATLSGTLHQTLLDHTNNPEVHTTISGISSVSAIQISTTATLPEHSEGLLFWDDESKCLAYYNEQNDMVVQIAQEQLIRIVNNTGEDIPNGTVVHIHGSQGNRPTIHKSIATSEDESDTTIGVTTHLIPNNSNGYITVNGLVHNINTSNFIEGAVLYLSPTISGAIVNTKPSAPNHAVMLGYCIKVGTVDGIIHVQVRDGWETSELHDVASTQAISGDILLYNGSYYTPTNLLGIINTTISGSITNDQATEFAIAMAIAL